MERFVKTLLLLVVGLSLFSCTRDNNSAEQATKMKTTVYKIAVVLPLSQSDNYKKRIDNTVDWALENLRCAQQKLAAAGGTNVISLDIEWYDEDKVNLAELGAKLTQRDSILADCGTAEERRREHPGTPLQESEQAPDRAKRIERGCHPAIRRDEIGRQG